MSPRISIRLLAAQSDQRLVALAREGHERAFEALVHRYRRPLLRYTRRMRLSEARGEDVLQQAFLQAWIALTRGATVQDVRAWFYRIVHNVAVNAMRGPAAEAHGELTQAVQDRAGLAGVSNIERSIAMRDALGDVAALPQMQQQAIFLTAVDGQTHSEVADVLGVSEGALRGLLYRARATLRSAAAALTPPPLLAWASAGAGSSGPGAERLVELAGGGGAAAGMAGLLLKGVVVAVTAGAVATGASVLSAHHRGGGHRAAHSHAVHPTSGASAGPARSFAFASAPVSANRHTGARGPALRHGRFGARSHRGAHGRHGSSGEAHRRGMGSGDRSGEQMHGGAHDMLVSGDGRGARSGRSAEGESSGAGSGDLRAGGRRDSSRGGHDFAPDAGAGSSSSSGRDGSGYDGSGADASLADSDSGPSPPGSSAPVASIPGEAEQSVTAGAGSDDATASTDRQSGEGEGDG